MKKGMRYQKEVEMKSRFAGQKQNTYYSGFLYGFETEENEKLYWDTNSKTFDEFDVGSFFKISFTVLETQEDNIWLGENGYEITRVRLVSSKTQKECI